MLVISGDTFFAVIPPNANATDKELLAGEIEVALRYPPSTFWKLKITLELRTTPADGGRATFSTANLTLGGSANPYGNSSAKVKVYASQPSDSYDPITRKGSTVIRARVTLAVNLSYQKDDYVSQEVTFFKGVRLEFEGRFSALLNGAPEGWRPGTKDPNNPLGNSFPMPVCNREIPPPPDQVDPAEVCKDDSLPLIGPVSFSEGDASDGAGGPFPYRDWVQPGEKALTKIVAISALSPAFDLKSALASQDDPLRNDAQVHLVGGMWAGSGPGTTSNPNEVNTPGTESWVQPPKLMLKSPALAEVIRIDAVAYDGPLIFDPTNLGPGTPGIGTTIKTAADSLVDIDPNGKRIEKHLAQWLLPGDPGYLYNTEAQNRHWGTLPGGGHQVFAAGLQVSDMSKLIGSWGQDRFKSVVPTVQTSFKRSVVAKALYAVEVAQTLDDLKVNFVFFNWNWWTMCGEIGVDPTAPTAPAKRSFIEAPPFP